MIELILFILATAGLTNICTQATIFKPFREYLTIKDNLYFVAKKQVKYYKIHSKVFYFLNSIFNCATCFGFWGGGIIYLLIMFKLNIIIYCLSGSFVSAVGVFLLRALSRK